MNMGKLTDRSIKELLYRYESGGRKRAPIRDRVIPVSP